MKHLDTLPLEVVVWPARAQARKTGALLIYLSVVAWVLGVTLLAPLLAITAPAGALLVFVGMLFLLRAWFLPTRYRFSENGIEHRALRTRRFPWSRFRSVRREPHGYYLSPFSNPRRFDNFRGLYLFVDNFVSSSPRSRSGAPLDTTIATILREKIGDILPRR